MRLLLVLVTSGLFAQHPIAIHYLKLPEEFTPGTHHVLALKLTNSHSDAVVPSLHFQVPKGWYVLTQPMVGTLQAGGQQRLLFTVALPANVAHGEHQMTVVLRDKTTHIILGQQSITVTVKKHHKLSLEEVQKPHHTKGGAVFECVYQLKNEGNTKEHIKLSSLKGIIEGDKQHVLAMDSTMIIRVRQKVPEITNQPQTIINDLIVVSTATKKKLTKKTPIIAYPNKVQREDVYHRYPIETSWLYDALDTGKQQFRFLKYAIKGEGYLDRTEKHQLKFILKGTNRAAIERFENYSRFMIQYGTPNFGLVVGDFTLSVSRLLERLRLGRGALFKKKDSTLTYSLFYNKLRFFPDVKDQFGGTLKYHPKEHLKFGLHSIWRNLAQVKGGVFSASGTAAYKQEAVSLEGEYAFSHQTTNWGGGGFLKGSIKKKSLL